MLVSVVIPCHNAARWLAQTLESAFAQSHQPTEIIVIDDGSTDDSLAIAHGFAGRGVRVVAQPNRGASAARNHGLRLARGSFIQYLDADDLITPDKIAAQVTLLDTGSPDRIATCRWGRFQTDPAAASFVDEAVFRDFAPLEYLVAHTGSGHMMHPAAWLVPRAVVDRAGPWDESLSLNDDGEYFARVALAAREIVFSPTGAALYRSGQPSSLSRRRSRPALESLVRSVALVTQHVLNAEDSPHTRRAVADYWQRLAFELYPAAPDLYRQAESEVRRFGGSELRPPLGPRLQLVARVLGWRLARRLQCLRNP